MGSKILKVPFYHIITYDFEKPIWYFQNINGRKDVVIYAYNHIDPVHAGVLGYVNACVWSVCRKREVDDPWYELIHSIY